MSKDLIIVPDYSMNVLRRVVEIRLHSKKPNKNEELHKVENPKGAPIPEAIRRAKTIWEKCGKEYLRFFMGFTYAPSIHDNPRDDVRWLVHYFKDREHANTDHFCQMKTTEFKPKYAPGNYTLWLYEVDYLEVREELVPYLEQKCGDSKYLQMLKAHFARIEGDNATDLDTYLKEKVKYMGELDLDGWLDDLKKEQGLKVSRRKHEALHSKAPEDSDGNGL